VVASIKGMRCPWGWRVLLCNFESLLWFLCL
jgi:hypothetical protein